MKKVRADNDNADTNTRMPRWVKTWGIVAVVVIVVLVAAMLLGGGQHGPSRHFGLGSTTSVAHGTTVT